jgi:hypothetical protein
MPSGYTGHGRTEPSQYDPQVLRVYAASLDEGMCEQCAALAGAEFHNGDLRAPSVPNPACTSVHGCRCVWIILGGDGDSSSNGPSLG